MTIRKNMTLYIVLVMAITITLAAGSCVRRTPTPKPTETAGPIPITMTPSETPTGAPYPGPVQPTQGPDPYPYPAPIVGEVEELGELHGENGDDVVLPNDITCTQEGISTITFELPGGGMVTGAAFSLRVATTGYTSDLAIDVRHGGSLRVWEFEGDYTGGDDNKDDDAANDQDVELYDRQTTFFNGLAAGGAWELAARHCTRYSSAWIDSWELTVWYTTDAEVTARPNRLYYSYTYEQPERIDFTANSLSAADLAGGPAERRVVVLMKEGAAPSALGVKGLRVERSWGIINGFAATVDGLRLAALERSPDVLGVWEDVEVSASLPQGRVMVRAEDAWALGYNGEGVTTAVFDTGIDTDHPAFVGAIAGQHCFLSGGGCPGGGRESASAEDDEGHGTSVSNIIAGRGNNAPRGVAPGAQLVAVKILDRYGSGYLSDAISAYDWLLANHPDVRVVNMSLGGGMFESACDSAFPPLALAIEEARQAGMITFAASGNEGQRNAMSMPACMRAAQSVGAVYDANLGSLTWGGLCQDANAARDTVICYSNDAAFLDFLAPSYRNRTATIGGATEEFGGTSAASPYAAGVGVLLLDRFPAAPVDYISERMKASGKPVTDGRTGRTHPRVDAYAAITESGFEIANVGASGLEVTAISHGSNCWLTLSYPSLPVTLAPGEMLAIGAVFNHCVGPGNYADLVQVETSAGELLVPVTMDVGGAPGPTPTPTEAPVLEEKVYFPIVISDQ